MIRVLGVDPGTNVLGYGVIDIHKDKLTCVKYGTIVPKNNKDMVYDRLKSIAPQIESIIDQFSPSVVAIETFFVGPHSAAALALGRMIGIIYQICWKNELEVFDYEPKKVKKAVATGSSKKNVVAMMVKNILELPMGDEITQDATDALAVAICHCNRLSLK